MTHHARQIQTERGCYFTPQWAADIQIDRIEAKGIIDPGDTIAVGKDHIGLVYSVQVADATVRERDKYGEGEWWPVVGDGWLTHEPYEAIQSIAAIEDRGELDVWIDLQKIDKEAT